jgi:hypothetical protein
MLENDLRAMFEWQASSDQPPAQVSFPVAHRRAQLHRRWRRATTIGAPIVAAAAAVAIGLTASLVSGAAGTRPAPTGPSSVAPQRFNPLVPYAAATWYPYRISGVTGYSYPNALRLIPLPFRPAQKPGAGPSAWTSIVVYAANQCVQATSRLRCGATGNQTSGVLTLSRRAPDVGRHAAYWVSSPTGDLTPDIPPGVTMVAFHYARLGWAMVESTGTSADVIRIAANMRFGQTAPLRFPIRLTGLPPAWREVQSLTYLDNGPQVYWFLRLGRHPWPIGPVPPRALYMIINLGHGPKWCEIKIYHLIVINGYRVCLSWAPASRYSPASEVLAVPFADGLNARILVTGPDAPLSPAEVFARMRLLGPDPAHWTTTPISP